MPSSALGSRGIEGLGEALGGPLGLGTAGSAQFPVCRSYDGQKNAIRDLWGHSDDFELWGMANTSSVVNSFPENVLRVDR